MLVYDLSHYCNTNDIDMSNKFSKLIQNPAYTWKTLCLKIVRRCGGFLSDEQYLKCVYHLRTNKKLDLRNPQTFNEKLQWLKLYNRKPEYKIMVDKYMVREYIKNKIGEQYLIPLIGVWDRPEDVDFESLPDQFVLKTTHSGGSSGVIICKNKLMIDKLDIISKLNESLKQDIYNNLREWPYKGINKRVIAEKYMEDESNKELSDYKFFCFNGEPKYCQVIANRKVKETIDFFNMEWDHQDFVGLNPKCTNAEIPALKPTKLEEMIEIAKALSVGIPFLRVDLYYINGKVYFGETTFFPYGGVGCFTPEEWDENLGRMILLPDPNM